jgi:UDP-2,3-diacylglucosamine pyrophosphatase LpxH
VLVIVSDLHLTDGSTANNFNPQAFGILASEIQSAARERGAREVKLVLLGDVFDFVRTDYWHRNVSPDRRPWGGKLDDETAMNVDREAVEAQFTIVLESAIARDKENPESGLGACLQKLDRHFTEKGQKFSVTYVIGNHDRVLLNFPSLGQYIHQEYPAITDFTTRFDDEAYALVARHGHEWDDNCHAHEFRKRVLRARGVRSRFEPETYRVMAIGEVVTAELMSGLVHFARTGGADEAIVRRLKDVNNLRPMTDVFEWLDWFGGAKTGEQQGILYRALKQSLDAVLDCSFARRWDELTTDIVVSGDLVDRLQLARTLLLGENFRDFRKRAGALETLQRALSALDGEEPLREGAVEEYRMKDHLPPWTQHLVYGHTHRARRDYFAADIEGGARMYINTGTFLPLITRTADGRSFATELQMTMVFVYSEEEDAAGKRDGPSLDIWNGTRRKQYA